MMGALGNGRRGGRSSSLLLIALISCILLLGFNYWVSNSRNVELQSKLLELEDRMRKLSVESDREQQKAEEEMRRQNEQLELMAETHQRQQESALNTWNREKEILKLNISSSGKMVQDMKNHMKSLLEDVSKRKSDLQSCQINMDSISKKASNEMNQCNKQIEAIKEECKGKIAAVKLEKQKTFEKVVPENTDDSMQKVSVSKAKADVPATNHSAKSVVEPPNGEPDVNSSSKDDVKVQTNEIVVEKDVEDTLILLDPISKQSNKTETLKRTNEGVPEVVEDIKEQPSKPSDAVLDEAGILDPKDEDIGIGVEEEEDVIKIRDRKEEDAANGKEDAVMYDNEGEIEKQLSKIKDENQDAGQDLEDDVANYNGNDDNQPESEDDKQAELARM